jgi:hypothetical protein
MTRRDRAGILSRMSVERRARPGLQLDAPTGPADAGRAAAFDLEAIAPLLAPTERVVASRPGIAFDRRMHSRFPELRGDLYVTDRRLILLGRHRVLVALEAVVDAAVVDDRLLLAFRGGTGLTIAAEDVLRLRKEISTARAALRRGRGEESGRAIGQSSDA